MRALVPFGHSTVTGYVIAVTTEPDTRSASTHIREALARLEDRPSIPPDLLALTSWVAERYLAPLGQCLRLAFPGSPERVHATTQAQRPSLPATAVRHSAAWPSTTPPAWASSNAGTESRTNEYGTAFHRNILDAITRCAYARILLPATTGNLLDGYKNAIQATLDQGRTALVLAPEIAQVESLSCWGMSVWGTACQPYHAGLSPATRRQAWARIQAGKATVVIGARSAIFAPLTKLGLILVDQEDHPAYKAENVPRYDARVVANERATRAGAVLALASAHPSLETVHATGADIATFNPVAPLSDVPIVTVADLRDAPFGDLLSEALLAAIAAHLAEQRPVLLFLNRKGYASVLVCRDCGQAVTCPTCAIGWTFHKREGLVRCRACGQAESAPERCSGCSGTRLAPSGSGTEALEDTVRTRFPTARVARLEKRQTGGDQANAAILARWQAKALDILIGTQLVVTRQPRPVAALVGLVYPDAALHLPDFHSSERAYHTLSDVMALADPHDPGAEIVLQTYVPQHHVIRSLAERTPAMFYEQELAAREALGYPPFGHLIGLRVSGTKEECVDAAAIQWAAQLRAVGQASARQITILGPIPATPARLRGRFRRQLMVKGPDGSALRHTVRATVTEMEQTSHAGGLRYDIDVDPQSLL